MSEFVYSSGTRQSNPCREPHSYQLCDGFPRRLCERRTDSHYRGSSGEKPIFRPGSERRSRLFLCSTGYGLETQWATCSVCRLTHGRTAPPDQGSRHSYRQAHPKSGWVRLACLFCLQGTGGRANFRGLGSGERATPARAWSLPCACCWPSRARILYLLPIVVCHVQAIPKKECPALTTADKPSFSLS